MPAAPTLYTIYLVNNSTSTQQFWCFLAPPDELVSDPDVFANSSTTLAVAPQSESINTFTIPVQYVVGAGADNQAVGLNIKVASTITKKAELLQTWDAGYATVPPNQGPTLKLSSDSSKPNTIAIRSNAFNQGGNEANGWFSNMSYGIQTAQGFIGMSWSPAPQKTRTLTPKLQFYVATGSFGENSLASWTDVSNGSASISVPGDFRLNKTTVTLTELGGWLVTPGAPALQGGRLISLGARNRRLDGLIQSHMMLSESLTGLIAAARPSESGETVVTGQQDMVAGVTWNSGLTATEATQTVLKGKLTVSVALAAAFTVFVLAGITFTITNAVTGSTQFEFTYNGTESVEHIKALFELGARIALS